VPAEDLISFDPRAVELRWEDNRWQLVAGGVVLKDFGRRETDARDALRLIRDLRLTQVGRVGTPQPVMEYWLCDGKAPQGLISGQRVVPLDTGSLKAEQLLGRWCVRDAYRILFTFGTHADECQQAVRAIQRYGFTQLAYVGHGAPAMLLFLNNSTPGNRPPSRVSAPPAGDGTTTDPGLRATVPPGVRNDRDLTRMPAVPHIPSAQPHTPEAASQNSPLTPAALPSGRQLGASGGETSDFMPVGDRVPVHWRQVQLRQEGKDWKLVLGGYTLASFGPNERAARLALSAVQYYRISEQCLIGHPKPAFSYFLSNGQAPQGVMLGLQTTPFRPDALAVQKTDAGWVISEGARPLLAFGDREEEAKAALQAIQRFRFDALCRVGQGDAALTIPVRLR
jgi:hypothetical protein